MACRERETKDCESDNGTKEKLRVSVRACVGASERERERERERKRGARKLLRWLNARRARKFVAASFGAKDETARAKRRNWNEK